MLPRISSASLVQANGLGWSFQWSMNAPMVSVSWRTEVKEPRRMDWRVMTEKKHSINRPWGAGSSAGCCSGVPGEPVEVFLDAGDDA